MAKSKKGIITKQNVINAARQLFYDNGYNKTGIQEIADYAGVKLGTVTYYYKKKDDMIGDIFNTFFMSLYDYVTEQSEKTLNLHIKYCYALVMYYDKILSDEHNARLYYEVLVKNGGHWDYLKITKTLNRSCLDFLNKTYTESDLEVITLAEHGARKELIVDWYEKEAVYHFQKDELTRYLVQTLFRLMDIDSDMVNNTINQAFAFLKSDYPETIKFLV